MTTKRAPHSKRKRAARDARLKTAREWVPSVKGKNPVKAYAKRFGVDLGCALRELQVLRVPLGPAYVERLSRRLQHLSDRRRPKAVSDIPEGYGVDWDDNFSFIAGFTSGGAPYGTTWEKASGEGTDVDEDLPAAPRASERSSPAGQSERRENGHPRAPF
jgi:hypothetical protein